ncbi:hypothetical protein Tco_0942614, partial [Tanacetum coccineum]
MAETMEKYVSKTRADYRLGVARPKIEDKDNFELKGQFLKELRTNTFSGSDHEDANEHIEKVLEIVDLLPLFQILTITKKWRKFNNLSEEPDENLYQAWERFKELLMKCPQHYLTEMQEVILFYNGLGIPTRQILDSRGAIPSKTAADAKVAIQEMAEYSQKWHNGTSRSRSTETSDGLAAIQAQLNNLGREIKKVNEKVYAAQVGCEQCKGPYYTKDCPLEEEGKTLEEAYYMQFGGPFQGGGYRAASPGFYQRNNANPSYQERRQSMKDTLNKFISESAKRHEENSNLIKEIQASTDAAIRNQGASIKTLEIQIGQMRKDLTGKGGILQKMEDFEDSEDKLNIYKDLTNLELKRSIKRVYMLSLRERMELDLEARLMGETLVINKSLDPLNRDYIELNDLNEPFELRRNQGDDLMPTIEEGE